MMMEIEEESQGVVYSERGRIRDEPSAERLLILYVH